MFKVTDYRIGEVEDLNDYHEYEYMSSLIQVPVKLEVNHVSFDVVFQHDGDGDFFINSECEGDSRKLYNEFADPESCAPLGYWGLEKLIVRLNEVKKEVDKKYQDYLTRAVRVAASNSGKKGGESTSPVKKRAARANGKKGGRPRKKKEINGK
jgi:hypothetical protein